MATEAKPLSTLWRVWTDLGYAVHAEVYEYYMEVKVYECYVWTDHREQEWDGTSPVPEGHAPPGYALEESSAATSPSPVSTAEEAQVYLSGSVKWDGCSNLRFDEQDNVMLHFCDKEAATNIGVLLGRLYDLAAEMIPAWDG